jgi:site-specific DNA-methyltransferase (adenine-specific)
MQQAKSLSDPMTQQGNKKLNEKRIHPCHKPILLYQKLISDYGTPGGKILDTHVGGGSSRIAASIQNCHYTGFEIDKEYFDKQEKRHNQFISQLSIF